MSYLQVTDPGVNSIFVDGGRLGWQHLGITVGGPADRHSCGWANRLCGNREIKPSVEIIGAGFECFTQHRCIVAVTGGVSELLVNGQPAQSWQSLLLEHGDELKINRADNGLRTYIAVSGGFDCPQVFDSCASVARDKLGGQRQDGSSILVGDKLQTKSNDLAFSVSKAPEFARFSKPSSVELKVVAGYQYAMFTPTQLRQLTSREFQLNASSSKMAARFDGRGVDIGAVALRSEGIARGAVQIPPDGIPIVMLDDRQSIGGYPKIGSVTSSDCDKLGQLESGTRVSFVFIDIQKAHNLICLQQARLNKWHESLGKTYD